MSLVMLMVALSSAAQPANEPKCPRTAATLARDNRKAPEVRKLNQLPSASGYAAVYRRIDGCEVPLPIRFNPARR